MHLAYTEPATTRLFIGEVVAVDSRPTPSGFQHFVEVQWGCPPDAQFTDPVRALADLEAGMTQPVVEVIKEYTDGGVVVQVSVFSDNAQPSRAETAAIEGLAAELRFADA